MRWWRGPGQWVRPWNLWIGLAVTTSLTLPLALASTVPGEDLAQDMAKEGADLGRRLIHFFKEASYGRMAVLGVFLLTALLIVMKFKYGRRP